jgi:uncharacterized membrane protein
MPAWNGLHPLAVHFPIALLTIVPVFIVLARVWRGQERMLLVFATVLAAFAAASAFLAAATGEAASESVTMSAKPEQVLERHEELAEMARSLTVGAALILAVVTAITWRRLQEMRAGARLIGAALLLAVCAVPLIPMANAAHQGGRLVHEFGVVVSIAQHSVPGQQPASPTPGATDHNDV